MPLEDGADKVVAVLKTFVVGGGGDALVCCVSMIRRARAADWQQQLKPILNDT